MGEKREEEEEEQRRHLDPGRRRRLRASSSSSSLSRHRAAAHANPARTEELERRAAASERPTTETSARSKRPAEPAALTSSEEHAEELFRRDIFSAAETALEPGSGCASPCESAATTSSSAARVRVGARLIINRTFVGIAQHLESFRNHWTAGTCFAVSALLSAVKIEVLNPAPTFEGLFGAGCEVLVGMQSCQSQVLVTSCAPNQGGATNSLSACCCRFTGGGSCESAYRPRIPYAYAL